MSFSLRKNGAFSAEYPASVFPTDHPAEHIRSPDNKMLTPTMKLNRPEISKQYAAEIAVSDRVTRGLGANARRFTSRDAMFSYRAGFSFVCT